MGEPLYQRCEVGVSFAGIVEPITLRPLIDWAAGLGFRAVHLNAAAAELRPRELSRSARRDLAATLRRAEVKLAGVDLWVPSGHFVAPEHSDRAFEAVREAVGFAAEMKGLVEGGSVVCVSLPQGEAGGEARRVVGEFGASLGVVVADHAWPVPGETEGVDGGGVGENGAERGWIGIGLDPAAVFAFAGVGGDPGMEAARLGGRLVCARLSDLSAEGRVEPGAGRLDVEAYLAMLDAAGYRRTVVLDLRGLKDQTRVALRVAGRLAAPAG